jgi:hypothetical protein
MYVFFFFLKKRLRTLVVVKSPFVFKKSKETLGFINYKGALIYKGNVPHVYYYDFLTKIIINSLHLGIVHR